MGMLGVGYACIEFFKFIVVEIAGAAFDGAFSTQCTDKQLYFSFLLIGPRPSEFWIAFKLLLLKTKYIFPSEFFKSRNCVHSFSMWAPCIRNS